MDKVIRDGKVAVLYSPGYGAGWYTWNSARPECLFDPEIVALVEKKDAAFLNAMVPVRELRSKYKNENDAIVKEIAALAERKWGKGDGNYFCTLGAEDLTIAWVPEGTLIRVCEYDGAESIEVVGKDSGYVTV